MQVGEQLFEDRRPYAIASDPTIQVLRHTEVPYVRSDSEDPFISTARSVLGAFGADYPTSMLQEIFKTTDPEGRAISPFKQMLSLVKMGVGVALIEDTGTARLEDLAEEDILREYANVREPYELAHRTSQWYSYEAQRIRHFATYAASSSRDYLASFIRSRGHRENIEICINAGALVQMFVEGDLLFFADRPQPGRKASLLITGLAQELASGSERSTASQVLSSGVIAHCAYAHQNNNIKDMYIPWEQLEAAHTVQRPVGRRILALKNAGDILHLPPEWEDYETFNGDGSSQIPPVRRSPWPKPAPRPNQELYQTTDDMDTIKRKWAPHDKSYSDRCVPAALSGAIRSIFYKKSAFSRKFFEEITEYVPGFGASCGPAIRPLIDMGLHVRWIARFQTSLEKLATREGFLAFLRNSFDDEGYQKQLALFTEEKLQKRTKMFARYAVDKQLLYEDRVASFDEISTMLSLGSFVIIAVDGGKLFPRSEQPHTPNPHVVLAVGSGTAPDPQTGRSVRGLIIQNSDGIYGNIPNQFVSEQQLAIARRANSKEMGIVAIRPPLEAIEHYIPRQYPYANSPLSACEEYLITAYERSKVTAAMQ